LFADIVRTLLRQTIAGDKSSRVLPALWSDLFDELKTAEKPGSFLRDVHSPQPEWLLSVEPLQQIGLLDFQDALWGPQLYDLAIFDLFDARHHHFHPNFHNRCWTIPVHLRKTPF